MFITPRSASPCVACSVSSADVYLSCYSHSLTPVRLFAHLSTHLSTSIHLYTCPSSNQSYLLVVRCHFHLLSHFCSSVRYAFHSPVTIHLYTCQSTNYSCLPVVCSSVPSLYPFIHPFTESSNCLLIHPCTYLGVISFVYPFINLSIHSLAYPQSHPLIHPSIIHFSDSHIHPSTEPSTCANILLSVLPAIYKKSYSTCSFIHFFIDL